MIWRIAIAIPYAIFALVVCAIAECCGPLVADRVSWWLLGL